MASPISEHTQQVEQKITNVLSGGDSKNTQAEVDNIMDEALPAFLEKKGVNLQTGERTTPAPEERKEHAPATPEQKEELKGLIDDHPAAKVEPEKKEEVKEVVKEEAKVAPEKKEEVKPEAKFTDLSDEGINREVESLKGPKAETKERYALLLKELKASREAGDLTKKEFDQAKKELAETKKAAEESSKKAVVPEDVLKQQQVEKDELAMFRRQYQLERDPDVKKNYDDRVDAVEQAIATTLTESGVPPKAVELIKNAGGWIAFSKSKAPMSWTDIDAGTGEQVVRRGTQADYARFVLNHIDPVDSSAVNARSGEQALLKDNKQRFIDDEKKKASEYFKTREDQFKAGQEAMTANQKKLDDKYNEWAEGVIKESDFLKDVPTPDKATDAEKSHIKETNTELGKIREYIKAQARTTSFDAYTDLVMHAAKGQVVDRMIKFSKDKAESDGKRIAELEAELAKVRGGNRSVAKGGSLTGSGGSVVETPKKKAAETADDIMADLDKFASEHAT